MAPGLEYAVALSQTKGVGCVLYKELIEHFGTAERVYQASAEALQQVGRIGPKLARQIKEPLQLDEAQAVIARHKKARISIIPYESPSYPRRLKHIYDPPPLLYCTQEPDPDPLHVISIVGSRNMTQYGKESVEKFVSQLSSYKATIVSGLAFGVDITAHQAALEHGLPTLGVMGGGLDVIYPAEHRPIALRMQQSGGLISEYALGVPTAKTNFPRRNRLLAGLADVTIVIEATEKSGAIITARYANEFGREVFALPGNITAPYSAGCNQLIKKHQAHILTDIEDLAYIMNWHKKTTQPLMPPEPTIELSADEAAVVAVLVQANQSLAIDVLSARTKLSLPQISLITLGLEAKNMVQCLPNGEYKSKCVVLA